MPTAAIVAQVAAQGFAFVDGRTMQRWLRQAGSLADWPAFEASWADLAMDEYMADGGRDRRRRHAVFSIAHDGQITREADQPHWQSLHYNPLNGGIARWFAPVAEALAGGDSLTTILRWCHTHFGAWAPAVDRWRVEVHQFRIEAVPGRPGRPTPEGMHRDGVDYVLVLMIRRTNIAEGTTTIHALDRTPLGSFTLAEPFDAALVDDARVYHGVTAVEPVDPSLPAYRDVLVVTFRAERAESTEE